MPSALTSDDWTGLADLARRAGREELADRVLVYQASDPLVLTMRDMVDELRGMREESRDGFAALSREIHESRQARAREVTPLPPAPRAESAVSRVVALVEAQPKPAAVVLLLALSIVVGGPQTVGRLLDYALGPVEVATMQVPVPVPGYPEDGR